MPLYELSTLASACQATLAGTDQPAVEFLLTDSRLLAAPGRSLFFCLRTLRNDGHRYVPELYQAGVRSFVIEPDQVDPQDFPEAGFILSANPLLCLQHIAAFHRTRFNLPVLGITGSNGKTVVKEWLFQLLHEDYSIARSPRSYNSQIGVPLSVWTLRPDHQIGIFEAGISQPGEMPRIEGVIRPTIGLFTHLGEPHQENFRDLNQKTFEKLILFDHADTLIYCTDQVLVHRAIQKKFPTGSPRLITWSKKGKADLQITGQVAKDGKTTLSGVYQGRPLQITIPFLDEASIENAIHCWLFLLTFGMADDQIRTRMLRLVSVGMRLELKEGINRCTLINDTYNSDLGSLSVALDLMNQQQQHPQKTLILSDILQSGRGESTLYQDVARMLGQKQVDRLIGIGESLATHAHLFPAGSRFFPSTEAFIQAFPQLNFEDETILIKGSRPFGFERISSLLQLQNHRTILEINLNHIIHNLNHFRSKLRPGVKVMCMVKAFSYGSGTYEIANILQFHGVDYLGVAFEDEGVALRRAGIRIPIVVMNPEPKNFEALVDNRLEPVIFSFSLFHHFRTEAARSGIDSLPVHIKLDTGMNRLGFNESDVESLAGYLAKSPEMDVQSVFSHLAASDEPPHDLFTLHQIGLFSQMYDRLFPPEGSKHPIRHILNSGGVERFEAHQYEMVRLGIGLYGVSSQKNSPLLHVGTFKSRIAQIRNVPAGQTIGYGRKGRIHRDSRIAIIPVGYSDGLRRKLGNGLGHFYINQHPVPIVGNICMDMSMADVTDVEAREGDEVIIFGDIYPVSRMAELLDTIPYEIMTGISRRVKRVYFHE